jgi:hypothetical protein
LRLASGIHLRCTKICASEKYCEQKEKINDKFNHHLTPLREYDPLPFLARTIFGAYRRSAKFLAATLTFRLAMSLTPDVSFP